MLFLNVTIAVGFAGVAFCMFMLVRNELVSRYRVNLLNRVSEQARRDIQEGAADSLWRSRYVWLDEVPYESMMNQFWRPLDSFYNLDELDDPNLPSILAARRHASDQKNA